MPSFQLRDAAEEDLYQIGLASRRIAGDAQMRRYLARLDHAFTLLAEAPEMGEACSHIRDGYRRLPQGSHVIFYRVTADGVVDIIRILHEHMQPALHLHDDDGSP